MRCLPAAARLLLLVLLVPAGLAKAAPFGDALLPRTLEETLDNGLKVVVAPRPGVGLVDLRIVVKVGGWLEGEHAGSGLSHYAEHLVAGGTTTSVSESQSAERLRAIGGLKNARTEADRTWIHVTTTPDGLGEATALLADWVIHPTFPDEEFTRERNVILREHDQADDQDARVAWDLLHAIAFTRHPARFPLLGERARFEALTRGDVVAFHARHWVPGNAIVSVVGDVDPGDAFHVVRRAFEAWPRARLPDVRLPVEPAPTGRREARRRGISPRSSIALGWRSVSFSHEDAIPLQVLKGIVADGADAPLRRAVVDDGLAGGLLVRARTPALGGGLFVVLAHVDPDDVARFEERTTAVLARMADEGPTDEEVERAKRRMRTSLVLSTRSVEDLAHALTRDWVSFEDVRFAETYVDRLARVTPEAVRRAAARTFAPERLSVAVVGLAEDVDAAAAAPDHEATPAVSTTRLPSGATLRLEPIADAPDVAMHVAFAGGNLREGERRGASAVLAELLLRSPAAAAARRRLEAVGGSVSSSSDRLAVEVAATGLREDLEALLDLLDAVATAGPVDEAEFANAKARARARGASRGRSARSDAEDRLLARAFGGPFLPPAAADAAWDALTAEAARAFAADVVCGPNLAVSLVGGFDPDLVRRRVEALDGRLADGPRWRPAVEAPSWDGFDAPTVFEPTGRKQVSIVVAFPGVGVQAQAERAALDLVDAWWSGRRIPSGPLYDALRGERDLAYAVEATHLPMPGAGLFFVHVRCAPERYAEAVGAIDGALATLAEAKLDEEDLRAARNVLLASRQSVVQTASARARLHALAEVYDLTGDGGDAYRSCVAATDLDAVRAAIRARFAVPGRRLVLWPEGVSRP